MVELRVIDEGNFIDALGLRLAPGQEGYVSHPMRSLAQAYVYLVPPQAREEVAV